MADAEAFLFADGFGLVVGVFAPEVLVALFDDGDGVGVGEDADLFAEGVADIDDVVRVVFEAALDLDAVEVELGEVGEAGLDPAHEGHAAGEALVVDVLEGLDLTGKGEFDVVLIRDHVGGGEPLHELVAVYAEHAGEAALLADHLFVAVHEGEDEVLLEEHGVEELVVAEHVEGGGEGRHVSHIEEYGVVEVFEQLFGEVIGAGRQHLLGCGRRVKAFDVGGGLEEGLFGRQVGRELVVAGLAARADVDEHGHAVLLGDVLFAALAVGFAGAAGDVVEAEVIVEHIVELELLLVGPVGQMEEVQPQGLGPVGHHRPGGGDVEGRVHVHGFAVDGGHKAFERCHFLQDRTPLNCSGQWLVVSC